MRLATGSLSSNGTSDAMPRWPLYAGLTAALIVAIGLVHHETAASIARIWTRSETYTHGWVILPFSAWLVWRERAFLAQIRPSCWWPALAVFLLLELVWIAGAIAGVLGPQQAALVAMIPAAVLLVLGPRAARMMLFPLGYLVFAIPWGEGLVPMLQDVTAHMAVGLLDVVGMPYFWEGRLISTPAGNFEVAEACAGVRYLIASLALGTLYAYLTYRSPWRRVLFMAASIVVPIVANGVRAWGIIMLASLSDMTMAVGVDHLIYGWVFFGLVMFLLFWLGSFWRDPGREAPAGPAGAGAPAAGGSFGASALAPAGAAATAVLLTLVASAAPAWSERVQPVPDTHVELPGAAHGWVDRAVDSTGWAIGFQGADEILVREYRSVAGGEPVSLLVIHYRQEKQGTELIRYSNRIHGDDWHWIGAGQRTIDPVNEDRRVRELRLRRNSDRRVLWSWYDIGGWQTASPVVAKVYAALKRLTGQAGNATMVVLGSGYDAEPAEARTHLNAFLEKHPGVLRPQGLISEYRDP